MLLLSLAQVTRAGRFESFTAKAAKGDKTNPTAATYFGSTGIEQFVAGGQLPDGTLVAFGNAWGPQFAEVANTVVLAQNQAKHLGLDPYLSNGKDKKPVLRTDDPDMAGFVAFYAPELSAVRKVVRFDWGVASISAATVAHDGKSLLITGRATPALRTVMAPKAVVSVTQDKDTGPFPYGSATVCGDVYLASLGFDGRINWLSILEGHRTPPPALWQDKSGNIHFDCRGMVKVSSDGARLERLQQEGKALSGGNTSRYLAFDPQDGSYYFGGDRNTNTGHQPWRQPYLYKFDAGGKKLFTYWEWPPKDCACGGSGNGLCSDSSPRAMDIAPNGDLLIGCWTDGGNTVVARQPQDWRTPIRENGFGMDCSGMKGANSLSWILRIDPRTHTGKMCNVLVSYLPQSPTDPKKGGSPNFFSVSQIKAHPAGPVAVFGKAATGFVQTPNAFYKYPDPPRGVGGEAIAVFSEDFKTLLFASYLPGLEETRVAATADGFVLVSRSRGSDGHAESPTLSPTINAIQKEKHGDYDAHIILLPLPPR